MASNNLSSMTVTNNANISYLNIENNLFTSFVIDHPALTEFFANGNPMSQLSLTQASTSGFTLNPITSLQTLYLNGYSYSPSTFTIQNFPNLTSINGSINPINGLTLENLPALSYTNINSPIKVTLKNIAPSVTASGFAFDVNEFHLENVSNASQVTLLNVRAKQYYFKNLNSVNNLRLDIDENTTGLYFDNLPILNTLKIESYVSSTITCVPLDFSSIPSLVNLEVNEIRYGSLNLNNLNQLKKISLYAKSCTPSTSALTIANLNQLEEITIGDNLLKNLNINSLPQLKHIKLYNHGSSNLLMSSLPQLQTFLLSTDNGVSGNYINSLDFSNFPSLQTIELLNPFINAISFNNLPLLTSFKTDNPSSNASNNNAIAYSFSNLPLLNSLILNSVRMNQLTLSNLPALKDLYFNKSYIGSSSYTFQNLPALENFTIEKGQSASSPTQYINEVSFNNLPSLKSITLKDFFYLNAINFGNVNTTLENFHLSNSVAVYGTLTSLSFDNFPQLKVIEAKRNLTSLQLNNLPLLHTLDISSNKFSTFTVSNLPSLQNFTSNYNLATGEYLLNFNYLPSLKMVNVNYNNGKLKKIDLSQVPQLEQLQFIANNYGSAQTLDYINLKNGNPNLLVLNTEYIKNICVDDDSERILLQSLDPSLSNTIFTSYCSFYPAGSTYVLAGNNRYNLNGNACNVTDPFYPNLKLSISTGNINNFYIANQSGNYSINFQQGFIQ